ncbi:MAG: hypothetical protein MUC37_10455 [Hyphomicrobium sp.]|jgi:H+/Cl- antiporter ClcA|nr:hypothetical protein [Hyphomicrobium sp.]
MLDVLSDFIRDFARIDSQSLTILLVLLCWATLLIQVGLESKTFTAVFVPGMFLGGMTGLYLTRTFMISLSAAKDLQAIIVSAAGIAVGFVATVLVIRLHHWIGDVRKPLTIETRR